MRAKSITLPGLGTYTFPDPVAKTATMSLKVGIDDDGNLWAESDKDNAPMFGVSGVGGSSSTLTRLWDSVGKTSTPGTDTVQAKSDFDMYEPFCRRKCVGTWAIDGDKAKFTVAAYYGDADYTEDGSMGDYVAVEINPLWWYESEDKSIIGVSGSPHPGWEPHPVCVAADGTPREKTYLPVYALALKDGHAVSLPGYQNEFGSYKSMWDKARTYGDGSLKNAAIIEPSVVDHYEWLLETIEFATQNCQTVMTGATSMRYAEDVITAAPAANQLVVTDTIGKQLVVGQTIYVTSNYQWTPSNISAYNVITAISACTEDGTLDASGSYRLITYNGTDRTSSITAGTTQIVSRPWITGATQGYAPGVNAVLGHTGSPVSNTNWKYPMMYRWRENTYGNQYMTALDLMDERVAVDDSYKIRWWYNPDLQHNGATKYYPADNNKPDTTDLNKESNGWITLSVETPTASYVNGYIKEEGADERHPCIRVPINTVGGSATSYICDFASLVDSYVVRAVRRRGHVASGSAAGPRLVSAYFSPAYGYWYSGAGLFMTQ